MSYSANSYNYATPLSSSAKLTLVAQQQLVDGRALLEPFTGTIDSNNIVTLQGNNATSNVISVPYHLQSSPLIVPNTAYYLAFELFEVTGAFDSFKVNADYLNSNQIASEVSFSSDELSPGTYISTVQAKSTFTSATTSSLCSSLVLLPGQSATVRFRVSLAPLPISASSFVYQKYEGFIYPTNAKYFELSSNTLDGTYSPVANDVGLWSAAAPSNDLPYILTVTDERTINAFRMLSSPHCFPTVFTIRFYDNETLLKTIGPVEGYTSPAFEVALSPALHVTKQEVTVNEVSVEGAAAQIYSIYNPNMVKRVSTLHIRTTESSAVQRLRNFESTDTCLVHLPQESKSVSNVVSTADTLLATQGTTSISTQHIDVHESLQVQLEASTHIINTLNVEEDTLPIVSPHTSRLHNDIGTASRASDFMRLNSLSASSITSTVKSADTLHVSTEDVSRPTNIHTVMKDLTRQTFGKVYITYTDPLLNDVITDISTSGAAHGSQINQLVDGADSHEGKFFTLYDNDLSGDYIVMADTLQTGWTSPIVSGVLKTFSTEQFIQVAFDARPLAELSIVFDDSHGCIAEDFTVYITDSDGTVTTISIEGNEQSTVQVLTTSIPEVVSVKIVFEKVSRIAFPVVVLDIPVLSTFLYTGYEDESQLISMRLLEELTYDDDIEALGGMSANEIDVSIDNSDRSFNITSNSVVSRQLKRNRKIVPYLGAEVVPGEIEWHMLGTFWSYDWKVEYDSFIASVVGFDTIGLLDTLTFYNHQVLTEVSLGYLVEYVLTDAKQYLSFLEWRIDESLYEITVPYAWFAYDSHAAALRKISSCYPMHIYCDRQGRICAAPQKLSSDYFIDEWSNATNVIDTTYKSLYTDLPNIINITVLLPALSENHELIEDLLSFDISQVSTRTLNFNAVYVGDLVVTVDKDDSVEYSYEAYSWGIIFTFTGTGYVRSIACSGTALDTQTSSMISYSNADSIKFNGTITRNISADFIQTSDAAYSLLTRLLQLSELDKYDAEVNYRGDIALSINDPIRLADGLMHNYNIKRHELNWDGALSGAAFLNT